MARICVSLRLAQRSVRFLYYVSSILNCRVMYNMNVKGYDECVDSVPKYILNPIFCLFYFPQSVDLLSWVGEKWWICTECTRILYWWRIWHKCLCTLTLRCMYHSDTHTSMPKRHRSSSLFLESLCKLFIVQRIATLCFSSQMMPTYQDRTNMLCLHHCFHWYWMISVSSIPYTRSTVSSYTFASLTKQIRSVWIWAWVCMRGVSVLICWMCDMCR